MLSDSARSTTAAESRYRVRAPNSVARNILVVALDAESGRLAALFQDLDWRGITFVGFAGKGGVFRDGTWREVAAEMAVDVIIMIATAGHMTEMAQEIGPFALERGIKVSAILLSGGSDASLVAVSLQQLRPWTRTLTILDDESCLADFLHALGS
jgi:hypothetical protein